MPRRYVNELGHQEAVDQVFVAGNKQLPPESQRKPLPPVGALRPHRLDCGADLERQRTLYKSFDDGDYVHVAGTAQLYQGAMQVIATRLTKVDPAEVDETDFLPVPSVEIEKLVARLRE